MRTSSTPAAPDAAPTPPPPATVRGLFGYEAAPNLVGLAEDLPERAWRPDHVQEALGVRRGFANRKLQAADVAAFHYRPTACRKTYRRVVVRKNLTREKGAVRRFDEIRSCFFITHAWVDEADEGVLAANDRCDQETLRAPLKGGVRALRAPVDNLESNGAYRVRTALAWNLKAGFALALPEAPGRWHERPRQEKRWGLGLECQAFANACVRLPCQIVRAGRRRVYRLLSWNPPPRSGFRGGSVLRC